jgi:hypothetical protein
MDQFRLFAAPEGDAFVDFTQSLPFLGRRFYLIAVANK